MHKPTLQIGRMVFTSTGSRTIIITNSIPYRLQYESTEQAGPCEQPRGAPYIDSEPCHSRQLPNNFCTLALALAAIWARTSEEIYWIPISIWPRRPAGEKLFTGQRQRLSSGNWMIEVKPVLCNSTGP